MKAVIGVMLCLLVNTTNSGNANDMLEKTSAFLEKNVINRSVQTSTSGKSQEGKVSYDFKRTKTYINLVKTENTLSFDEVFQIEQTNFELKDGKRVGNEKSRNRILVIRNKLSKSYATGQLLGSRTILTNSVKKYDQGSRPSMVYAKFDGDDLVLTELTSLYADLHGKGDSYYPGAHQAEMRYVIEDGKLKTVDRLKIFKVDPKTFEKTFVESMGPFTDKEVSRLAD